MKRWILILIPVVALFVFIGWRITQKKAEAAQQKTERQSRGKAPLLVDTATVSRKTLTKSLEAVGSAEATNAVDISPKIGGRLLFLPVREGDTVKAGQVLARLDEAEINAEVAQKRATLAQAQQKLAEAQLTERPTVVGINQDIRRQQAALTSAQAQSTQARADYAAQIAQAQAQAADVQGRIAAASAQIAQDEAAIATARANLTNLQVKLDRQATLYKEGATAKQNVDDAQTAVDVAQAGVREAEQKRAASAAARNSAQAQLMSAQKNVSVIRNKAQATLATAGAGVGQARASLAASQSNTNRAPAYQASLRALSATVAAAQADVEASLARKSDVTLVSPLTGVVTRRAVDVGAFVSPGQAIVTVQAVQPIFVSIGVPEEISRKVFVGQSAQIVFDGLPGGKPVVGKVAEYVPAADPQSRQFTLRVRVDNPSGRIRPGMFGRVRIVTDAAKNALVVPLEAVKKPDESSGGGAGEDGQKTEKAVPTAAVVRGDKVAIVPVTTGLSDGKNVAVTSGLEEGDKVVILAGRDVKDGQAIRLAGQGRGGKGGGTAGGTGDRAGGQAPGGQAPGGQAPGGQAQGEAGGQTGAGAQGAAGAGGHGGASK